jgi:hypothetical protein
MSINPGEIVKQALEVARPITDTLSDAWQGVVGDRVAAWRLKNAAQTQLKVREELERLGLQPNAAKIPERYAFDWFEEATKQDEPEIQTLFARLLAKAAVGDKAAGDRRLLEIVSRLTPIDALVMQFYYGFEEAKRTHSKDDGRVTDVEIDEFHLFVAVRDEHGEEAWQSVEHLTTLGVLERRVAIDSDSVSAALSNLQSGPQGEVFPTWGSNFDLQVNSIVASTTTGLVLHTALAPPC